MSSHSELLPGDPAPWFVQRSFANPNYSFSTAAGRYIVLGFFGSAADDQSRSSLAAVMNKKDFFDDQRGSFFGVSNDPGDELKRRVANSLPGYRFLWDFDGKVGKLYGTVARDAAMEKGAVAVRRRWVVLDPMLRVMKVIPFVQGGSDVKELLSYVDSLPAPGLFAGFEVHAPVIVLPNVFEADLCQALINGYQANGGEESGFMREVDGKTRLMVDYRHKRRRDVLVTDPTLKTTVQAKVLRRIVPEIAKAYQFKVTRMERYLVACYAAEDEAHFQAHRDNTTKGTAHRRFAVTINLNDSFEGGELGFPEYGPRSFKPPVGCAVVFSCSLLHAVSPVRKGQRYAFLPFLYDDAAASIRQQNNEFLEEGLGRYSSERA